MAKGHPPGKRYKCLVDLGRPDECWRWLGSTNKSTGYGKKQWLGETWLAHRWVWTMLFGSIPDGMTINHKCGTRNCVNPSHLEVISQTENCRHGNGTKLTADEVMHIKEAGKPENKYWGLGAELAEQYGVSSGLIHDIWNGRAWRDIE